MIDTKTIVAQLFALTGLTGSTIPQFLMQERRMRRFGIAFMACLGTFLWSTGSHAVVVGVDQFSFSGTSPIGALSPTDFFSDGSAPPCGPAGCSTQPTFYAVGSTSPLSESGGYVYLNSSNGLSSMTALGGPRLNQTVTVSGQKSEMLQSGGAISTSGIFTLPALSGPLNNGYGIRFVDGAPGAGFHSATEVLELNVQYWTGNLSHPAGLYIRYLVQDFSAGTLTTIGAAELNVPTGDNEIYLSLDRVMDPIGTYTNYFEAQYQYASSGILDTSSTLTSLNSAEGFVYNKDYVRPQFHAFETTVPEPASLTLFGAALVGLVVMRHRCRRKLG